MPLLREDWCALAICLRISFYHTTIDINSQEFCKKFSINRQKFRENDSITVKEDN